jgi:hypothetical protein
MTGAQLLSLFGRSAAPLLLLFPLILFAFDHHGIERDPRHRHLGVHSDAAVKEALPNHAHGYEYGHAHEQPDEAETGDVALPDLSRVIVMAPGMRADAPPGTSAFPSLVTPTLSARNEPGPAGGPGLASVAAPPPGILPHVPEPPPRIG